MAGRGKTVRKRRFKDGVYARLARVPSALANSHRLELLELLAQRPRTVQDVAVEAGLTVANASQHLQVLMRAGVVAVERRGLFAFYRAADVNVYRLLAALREVAEAQDPSLKHAVRAYTAVDAKTISEYPVAKQLLNDARTVLLDARPREEFEHAHLPDAIHASLEVVASDAIPLSGDRRYVVYCRGPYCVFADEVVAALQERGLNAIRLTLGPPDWEAAGGELRRAS
jgi:rhodanese-related sulfurtransferase/DNA-binding transcriptional ArsR family regulator